MSGSDPSVSGAGYPGAGGAAGGSAGSTGSGAGGGRDDCPGQPFQTVLGSPNPDIVAELDEGDLLDVVKIDSPVRGVVANVLTGETVGAITRDIVRLRRCIDNGNEYEAEVIRMSGGSVTVTVRPR
jgi:hypothetical protein